MRRWWRATGWPEAVAGEWSRCAGGPVAGRGGASDVPARAEGGADGGAAVVPARVSGGNCSIRGATRRRHAVAVRLMVQNPLSSGPVSGGWAGRRPGVAGRVGCGQTRCCRGWACERWLGGQATGCGRARPGGWAVECGSTLPPAVGSVGRGCGWRMGELQH